MALNEECKAALLNLNSVPVRLVFRRWSIQVPWTLNLRAAEFLNSSQISKCHQTPNPELLSVAESGCPATSASTGELDPFRLPGVVVDQ